MKLKNKLIPFAIVTTAITAVTPLSVSCSSKNSMKDISTLEAAKPDFKPYHSIPAWFDVDEDEQEDTAMKAYIDFVKKDPKRFEQDMAWGVYQNWLSFYDNSNLAIYNEGNITHKFESKINKLEVSITNVEFGTTNILVPHSGSKAYKSYNTVSFKMKLHANADVNTVELENGLTKVVKKNIDTTSTVEYKNMLIFAMQTARNDKLEQFYNPTESTVDQMAYDTTKPGWLITISDQSPDQAIYDNYYEEHGIKYDTDITVNESVRYDDKNETITTTSGHYANKIKNTEDFNELVNEKNYTQLKKDSNKKAVSNDAEYIDDNTTIGRWFHQDPAQIIANSVLLDIWSYYFSNTYTSPKFYFSGDAFNPAVTATQPTDFPINALDPDDGSLLPFDEWEAKHAGEVYSINITGMKWEDSTFGLSDDCEYTWDTKRGLALEYDDGREEITLDTNKSEQIKNMSNDGLNSFMEAGKEVEYEPAAANIKLKLTQETDKPSYIHFSSNDMKEEEVNDSIFKAKEHDVYLSGNDEIIVIDKPFFNMATKDTAKNKIEQYLRDSLVDEAKRYLPYLDTLKGPLSFTFPDGAKIRGHFEWKEPSKHPDPEDLPYQFEMDVPENLVVRFGGRKGQ